MYNTFYTCDCCGKQMDKPGIVLTTRKDKFSSIENRVNFIEDRDTWHYCSDCWKEIKDRLISRTPENVEKLKREIDRLKEEDKRLRNTVDWWNCIFISLANGAIEQEKEQREARRLAAHNCCENINKDNFWGG